MKNTAIRIITICITLLFVVGILNGCSSEPSQQIAEQAIENETTEEVTEEHKEQDMNASSESVNKEETATNQEAAEKKEIQNEQEIKALNIKEEKSIPPAPKSEEKKPLEKQVIEPVKENEKQEEEVNKNPTVTISIMGNKQLGVILAPTSIEINHDERIIDVTKRVTREHGIQMESSGRGPTAYVEGIQNLYEFDHGPKSGWMIRLNGTFINKSSGSINVQNGDIIEWLYTLDLGKDLGGEQQ